ncbi:MAG: hypothetical protein AB7O67_16475 [Vicinamibacterales bacterium]
MIESDFSTVAGIVAATMAILQALKPGLAGWPGLNKIPVWVYAVLVACGLTWAAHDVFHLLEGELRPLLADAFWKAAAASGVLEWIRAGLTKPLQATTAARVTLDARKALILPLALLVGLGTASCALKGTPRDHARSGSVVVHDALAAAQDVETAFYTEGLIPPEQDRAWNAALAPALRIGKSLNLVVLAWPAGAPTPPELLELAGHLDALAEEVLAVWPEGRVRTALEAQIAAARAALRLLTGGAR